MLKKVKVIAMSLLVSVGIFGCSKSSTKEDDKFSVCLLLDEGGVLDQSFNQSA
jgi:basic membrane lipoprotein Med (substrate-binding protein (PBP1-ABC) superfamily)